MTDKDNVGCIGISFITAGVAVTCTSSHWGWGIGLLILGAVIAVAAAETKKEVKTYQNSPQNNNINKQICEHEQPAVWLGKYEKTMIAGIEIEGFVYIGSRLDPITNESFQDRDQDYSISYGDNYDAALITPFAKVNFNTPDFEGGNLQYWPNYSEIPPASRAAYLTWLANGKSNKDIQIGYVFLYFYGLERRLLFDPDINEENREPLDIINELIRLYGIYAEKNRSFRNYCSNLICQAFLAYYPNNIEDIPFSVLEDFSFEISPIVKYKFAELAKRQLPVPGKWAFALVVSHPDISLKMPAKRCLSEFKKLFLQLYEEKYGEGLIIKECKKKLSINYYPASSTLKVLRNAVNIPEDFKGVAELAGTAKRFANILEKCYELLNPYSRFLGRSPHLSHTLEAALLLPPQLIASDDDRIKKAREKLINNEMKERGLRSIKLDILCDVLGIPAGDNLSLKAIRDIKNSLSSLCLGFSPDYDCCGIKAGIDSQVVLFEINTEKPGFEKEKFTVQRIMLFLRLGMLIAEADGNVSSDETEYLTNMIDKNNLSENNRTRLWAFLEYLLFNKRNNSALKKNIEKLSRDHKNLLIQEMTAMVKIDGKIDKNEINQLGKIFEMLGLDKKDAITYLHRTETAATEPVVIAKRTEYTDYKIPPQDQRSEREKVAIDYDKVAMKQEETEEAFFVLDEIFNEEDINLEENVQTKSEDLDTTHKKLFDFIISKSEWPRSEVEEFCKPMQLMVDGAMEVINEYAILKYDEPLLEGDDPIYVELELVQEMQNG